MKTVISEDRKKILEELYKEGMSSKGKVSERWHNVAVERTGLPLQVLKDWIGNRKKVESGRRYEYKKAIYTRGKTAYNGFVSEKNADFQSIKEWAPAWKSLSSEEKEKYRDMAKAKLQESTTDKSRAAKEMLKRIIRQIVEVAHYGVDVAIVGVNKNDESQVFFGEGKTGAYFDTHPKIMEELSAFQSFGTEIKDQKVVLKDLRMSYTLKL